MERTILHCDLNGFYASVELLEHPELRDKPVAVCGDPEQRHGIILAKNEAAKAFQVKTAETIWQAKRKCPGLVLLPAHHHKYREYSQKVNAIYGYRAISRISLTQTAATGFAEGQAEFMAKPKTTPAPAPDVLAEARETAAPIADPGLRAALEALAQNILTRRKT